MTNRESGSGHEQPPNNMAAAAGLPLKAAATVVRLGGRDGPAMTPYQTGGPTDSLNT
jgi:hypothetical protein